MILTEQWKARARVDYNMQVLKIWLMSDIGRDKFLVAYPSSDTWTTRDFKVMDEVPPSVVLPLGLESAIIEALVNAGGKLPDHSEIKGKLQATERHLEDLRVLLKLRPKQKGV